MNLNHIDNQNHGTLYKFSKKSSTDSEKISSLWDMKDYYPK